MKTSGYTRQNIAKIKGRRERPVKSVETVTNRSMTSYLPPTCYETLSMNKFYRTLPVMMLSSLRLCKGLNMSPKNMTKSQTGAVSPIKNKQPSWNEML